MNKDEINERRAALREALKEVRKAASFTQAALAAKLGKPQSFVAKYENGERRLEVIEFMSVAEAIGVDPAGVLGKITNPSS